jgi:DNA-directed RNA polymerase subunit RPC12/RpoP
MPSIATRAVKNSDLQIQHQCPQCGAPASLLESDRLFSCAYCRVKSYLLARRYFQYRLPHKAPSGRELIYFPYWRFKGMLFSCLPESTHNRFIDTSHQACFSPQFPVSLGLRSQALTLNFVTAETPGHFITPQTSLQDVMAIFNRRFTRELSQPLLHQAHIGETVSMIYAPYYLGRGLVDAVLDQPLRKQDTDPFHLEDFPGGAPSTHFQFLPTLCPHCGWDLDGTRDAQVLNCHHCHSVWQPGPKGFSSVPCAHSPTAVHAPTYLPFWRITADISGVDLDSYADLVRLANLPKAVQKAWETTPFRFWVPAFKVRPRVFLRLMQVLSTALPPEHLERNVPEHPCLTANLPVTEAMETLRVALAGFIKPLERIAELLPRTKIDPRKALLVYLPFEERTHELVHTPLNLAVNKNQISLSWNL